MKDARKNHVCRNPDIREALWELSPTELTKMVLE
jgi:hypothetical protein